MKAIILGGGFGTRLGAITKETAKPLIEIGGKTIIEHQIQQMSTLRDVDEIIITTNKKFENQFTPLTKNIKTPKKITLSVEDARSEQEKLGSIGGVLFAIETRHIHDDCLILAGDNIITFDLGAFVAYAKNKQHTTIALVDVKNKEEAKKFGVVRIDTHEKIIAFEEKPKNPTSTLASIMCYIIPKSEIGKLKIYCNEGESQDRIGDFIEWLCKKTDVFGFVTTSPWFDIGDKETLKRARAFFEK